MESPTVEDGKQGLEAAVADPGDGTLRRVVHALRIPVLSDKPTHDLMLDALKGWAIILVVLGHAIAAVDPDVYIPKLSPRHLAFIFAYSFHMPLFMFVSGFLAFGKPAGIATKARRLLLPCVSWFFVNYLVLLRFNYGWKNFSDFLIGGLRHPSLWFLWVLFICFVLLAVVELAESRRSYLGWLAFLGIYVAMNLVPTLDYGMIQLKYLFPIFYLGYLSAKHRGVVARVGGTARKAFPFVVLAAYPFLFAALVGQITPASGAAVLSELFKDPAAFLSRFALALLGIVFSYCLLTVMRHTFVLPALAWLGLFTLDIYVSHGLFLLLAFGSGTVRILTGFIFGFTLPLALSLLVLRQSRVLGTLLLGLDYRSQPVNALVARVRRRRERSSANRDAGPREGAHESPQVE